MIDKIGTIRNPLTIIAIFAGIAEISGTAVLPFISDGNQSTYVWFLIVFPILLVMLFFVTLNFNHKVLYAPSDFKDEENFFKSIASASPFERTEKIKEELQEIENETGSSAIKEVGDQQEQKDFIASQDFLKDTRNRYLRAEELVIKKLEEQLGQLLLRNVRFKAPTAPAYIFDAVAMNEDKVTIIEIKYFRNEETIPYRIRDTYLRILSASQRLPDSIKNQLSLIIAVTTDGPAKNKELILSKIYSIIGVSQLPVEVRIFSIEDLEKEFNQS